MVVSSDGLATRTASAIDEVALFVLDDQGAVQSANPAGEALLNHPAADALRRAVADPEALAAARAGLAPACRVGMAGAPAERLTLWLSLLCDGRQQLFAVATPMPLDPAGITPPTYHRWIDDAPAMVGYLEPSGRWITANLQLQQAVGYPLEELRQRTFFDLLSDADRTWLGQRLAESFAGGLPDSFELRLRTRKGEPIEAEVATSPQRDATGGEISGICVLIRDVRDRKQREAEAEHYTHQLERLFVQLERKTQELEAANEAIRVARLQTLEAEELTRLERLKSAFLDVAAHELRTPVTLLTGILDLLRSNADPTMREALFEAAYRSTGRLTGIVDSALKLLHSQGRTPNPPFRLQRPAAILEAAVRDVAPFLELRGQHVRTELSHDLPEAELDASMIRDVVVNLLMNAIKFTPDGGEITLQASPEAPGWFCVEVTDRGLGIDEEDLPHIFDGFFCSLDTLHHSSGRYEYNTRGPGLGLAIVERFVKHHGGQVTCQSRRGEGTSFCVRLPARQDPAR